MEVLELNGTRYVKASKIARDFGYTADYVGQLCRGGKVDAQLVGRSWYVAEGSLQNHKQARYRTNTAKTKEELRLAVEETVGSKSTNIPIHGYFSKPEYSTTTANPPSAKKTVASTVRGLFYDKLKLDPVHYEEDGTELIPTLTPRKSSQEHALEVKLADAVEVDIKTKTNNAHFEAGELPQIKFKGNVKVSEPSDTEFSSAKPNESSDAGVAEGDTAPENVVDEKRVFHPVDKEKRGVYKVTLHTSKHSERLERMERMSKEDHQTKKGAQKSEVYSIPIRKMASAKATAEDATRILSSEKPIPSNFVAVVSEDGVQSVNFVTVPSKTGSGQIGVFGKITLTACLLLIAGAFSAFLLFFEEKITIEDDGVMTEKRLLMRNISSVISSIYQLK